MEQGSSHERQGGEPQRPAGDTLLSRAAPSACASQQEPASGCACASPLLYKMSKCFKWCCLQCSPELEGSRWGMLIQKVAAISCWLWEQLSSFNIKPNSLHHRFSEVNLPCHTVLQLATTSGTPTKGLLRPEWLTRTLHADPSLRGAWPKLGAFYGPRQNSEFFQLSVLDLLRVIVQLVTAFTTPCQRLLLCAIRVLREILGEKVLTSLRLKDQDIEANWWVNTYWRVLKH